MKSLALEARTPWDGVDVTGGDNQLHRNLTSKTYLSTTTTTWPNGYIVASGDDSTIDVYKSSTISRPRHCNEFRDVVA